MKPMKKLNKSYLILIVSISASGGLMFGFDLGVTSGAVNFWQDPNGWGLNDSTIELITSAMLIGATIGAFLGGRIADPIGRKKVIIAQRCSMLSVRYIPDWRLMPRI
jgi:MFS family permease